MQRTRRWRWRSISAARRSMPRSSTPTVPSWPGAVHRAPTGRDAARDEYRAGHPCAATSRPLAVADLGDEDRLIGIGIGSAGPVDLARGTIAPLNLPAIADLPHRRAGSGGRVRTSRCASRSTARASPSPSTGAGPPSARATRWRWSCRPASAADSSWTARWSTGRSGNAGHIGQLRLRERAPGAPPTDGTLESLASGPSAVAWARRHGWAGATGEELVERLRRRRSDRGRCRAPLGGGRRRGDRRRRDAARPRRRGHRGRVRARRRRLPRPGPRRREGCRRLRLRASRADPSVRAGRPRAADRRRRSRPALSRRADRALLPSPCDTMSTCPWIPPTC